MPIKSIIYKDEEVDNADRKFGANLSYFPCYVERKSGEVVPALFTLDDIQTAIDRATKNPEDIEEKANWLEKIFE